MENSFQVFGRNLVAAVVTDVLRGIGGHVHLVPAGTVGQPGKKMGHLLGWPLPLFPLSIEDGVTFVPEVFGDDGFYVMKHPFGFRLELPGFLAVRCLRVVGPASAFGGRITEETFDGRIRETGAVPRAIAFVVQEASDGLLPAVLFEEFVEQFADGSFPFIGNELMVFPLVAEGGLMIS